jgi:hypothetical protein
MNPYRPIFLLILPICITACSSLKEQKCNPGEKAMVNELLYFGTALPNGVVSDEDWSAFLRTKVTPRFPDGLSVWRASGQWQGKDEIITQEDSFVLNLVHHDDEDIDATIRAIADDYKARFKQEAVLRVKHPVCVTF